jgi:recombination protein RecA
MSPRRRQEKEVEVLKAKPSGGKKNSLDAALESIEATYGPGLAFQIGKSKPLPVRDFFPTGCIALDVMLGGGIPREMITEMFGPEGGGKSTLALSTIGHVQRSGELAAFIDVEQAFDPSYARKLGVDVRNLIISQPDYGEQALQIAETLIDSRAVGIVVIDSVANLLPRTEYEGEIGDQNVALLPRLMAQALRKLGAKVRKANVALVFINQLREKIGAMPGESPTQTPGGRALRHAASLRLDIRRIAQIKDGERVIGGRVRFKDPKSRVCIPYQEAESDLIYGEGFSREADIIDIGTELGIVAKESGSHYSFNGDPLGHGREKTRLFLKNNPELFATIHQLVMEKAAEKRNLESGQDAE